MERVEVLIHKLVAQQAAGESASQLLATTKALYNELIGVQPQPVVPPSRKVAVIMPSFSFIPTENVAAPIAEAALLTSPEAGIETQIQEEIITPPSESVGEKPQGSNESETYKPEPYALRKPVIEEAKPKESFENTVPIPAQNPSFQKAESSFNAIEEVPTLRHAPVQTELNQLLGSNQESLNDKLKADKTELAHALKTEPIKDLRKGIGVNDKFLFINELFRGDEAMYERSIKTINAFHILPEAEYWINRELKVKLGWSDTKETVQHFYTVVRRRFS